MTTTFTERSAGVPTFTHESGHLSGHESDEGRPRRLGPRQARLLRTHAGAQRLQGDGARERVRRRRTRDRHLPAGQGLRQALCVVADADFGALPASLRGLQHRVRPARSEGHRRQESRRSHLYADDRAMDSRHFAPRIWRRSRQGHVDDARRRPSRRVPRSE